MIKRLESQFHKFKTRQPKHLTIFERCIVCCSLNNASFGTFCVWIVQFLESVWVFEDPRIFDLVSILLNKRLSATRIIDKFGCKRYQKKLYLSGNNHFSIMNYRPLNISLLHRYVNSRPHHATIRATAMLFAKLHQII